METSGFCFLSISQVTRMCRIYTLSVLQLDPLILRDIPEVTLE